MQEGLLPSLDGLDILLEHGYVSGLTGVDGIHARSFRSKLYQRSLLIR